MLVVVKIHVCGTTVVCRGAGSCPLAILLSYYMRLLFSAVGDVPFLATGLMQGS